MFVNRWIGERKQVAQDSPLYSGSQTDIASGASIIQEFSETKPYDLYEPFNFFRITNQTNKTLIVYLNDHTVIVPSNTSKSVDGDTVPAFSRIRIVPTDNLGATGTVAWNWQKVSTVRDVLKAMRGF